MQSLIAEQPLILSLMLGLLAGALIYGWLQTGKSALAAAGLIAAALIPLSWVVAGRWQTDREQIESLMYETAAAVHTNDHERALDLIADEATRAQARQELGTFTFDEARITKIREIQLIDGSVPPEADVDMNVKIVVSQRAGGMQNVPAVRRLILRMQKQGERWRIIQYQHLPAVGGPDQFTTRRDTSRQLP
jgi:hypothetical protein